MKKDKRITSLLLVAVLLISTALMTACFNVDDDDDDYDEIDVVAGSMIMSLELVSDSDNGIEWEIEQEDELFDYDVVFMVNEGDEGEVSSETQSFEMFPIKAGTTTLRFTCEATDTTYTYVCEVSKDLSTIKIKSSEGESAGSPVEAPDVVFERD